MKISKDMATLVLQVPDESMVTKVKQACKMLMGVTSVKVQKTAKPRPAFMPQRRASTSTTRR